MNDVKHHIGVKMIFLLVIVGFFTLPAYSQIQNNTDNLSSSVAQPDSSIRFEHITVEDGLSDNRINGFLHDSEGYMWFGSQDGLNRYNGYEFTTFWSDPGDSSSLSGNYIEVLFEDHTNTMWVGTWGSGINRYDRQTETFERFRHDPEDSSSLANDYVNAIAEDNEGRLWIGTEEGLSQRKEATKSFKTYLHNPEDEGSLSHNVVRSMLVDQSGVLWIGTGSQFESPIDEGGLHRYNSETDSFIRYPGNTAGLVGYHVVALFEDASGTLWVGTAAGGLHRMDRERGTFEAVAPALREQGYLTFIFEDRDGRLGGYRDGTQPHRSVHGSDYVLL